MAKKKAVNAFRPEAQCILTAMRLKHELVKRSTEEGFVLLAGSDAKPVSSTAVEELEAGSRIVPKSDCAHIAVTSLHL